MVASKPNKSLGKRDAIKARIVILAAGLIGAFLAAVAIVILLDDPNAPKDVASQPGVTAPPPVASLPSPAAPGTIPDGPPRPAFDVVRINPNGDTVIAGRAAPGAEVVIKDGDEVIGRVRADDRGEWVFVPERPLPAGDRELSLSATNPGGRETLSENVVVLHVPERKPSAPAAAPIVVLTPNEGGASRVLQGPSPGAVGLTLDVIDYDEVGNVVLSGRAGAGSTIRLYVDERLMGEATVDGNGRWQLKPDSTVTIGPHRLRIEELRGGKTVTAKVEIPFVRAEIDAATLQAGFVVVQPGNSLWRLARRSYGYGTRYTVIFAANSWQIKDPNLIYPGQVLTTPTEQAPAKR